MIGNNINEQLLALYASKWVRYLDWIEVLREKKKNGESIDYTRPLLIKLKDEKAYCDANIKVMILGQETNGWAEGTDRTSPVGTMEGYVKFFKDGYNVKRRGPFWNETKKLIQIIKTAFPGKSVAYTYNNVVKIGRSSGAGFPGGSVYKMELDCFNVLLKEIDILKPDLLIFFSGPNYDNRIVDKLGSFIPQQIADVPMGNFCQLQFNQNLPLAFRMNHPRAMYRYNLPKGNFYKMIMDKCLMAQSFSINS